MSESTASTRPEAIERLRQAQDWPALIAACQQQLEKEPDSVWAWEDLARARFAEGREPLAHELLTSGLQRFGRESALAGRLREWLVADAMFPMLSRLLPEQAPGPEAIEDAILAAIYAQRRGDLARAAALCQQVLQRQPEHADALNHLGRALNNLGRRDEALACLRRSTELQPLNPESWHNLGHVLRALGRLVEALPAYRQALQLRPAYRSAVLNLGKTLLALDRPSEALPALQPWLDAHPRDVEALVETGMSWQLQGRSDEGEACYRRALAIDPQHAPAWLYLGTLLNERKDGEGAGAALKQAVRLLPDDAEAWAQLAIWHEAENDLDGMAEPLRRGLLINPRHPLLLMEAARRERRIGHPEAAVDKLRALSPQGLRARQQQAYWFELARNLDRCDRIDEAWGAFVEGNRHAKLALAMRPANVAAMPDLLERLRAWRPQATERWQADEQPAPIFLLGFPRSGLTLLNTMLGCHSDISSLEERPTIEACVRALAESPAGYPQALDALAPVDLADLRGTYRQQVRHFLVGEPRPVLVDMFPLRTLYVATIARLFPGAKVVFMQRHPADVVLSNFMQEYSINDATVHCFDIQDAARFYADTLAYWNDDGRQLPLSIHELRYEDLIAEPEQTLRRLLQSLELPWQDAVLEGHVERARDVRSHTSSYHQIAEPLYDRSVDRWRRYRRHLEPVLELLAPAAERFGYPL